MQRQGVYELTETDGVIRKLACFCTMSSEYIKPISIEFLWDFWLWEQVGLWVFLPALKTLSHPLGCSVQLWYGVFGLLYYIYFVMFVCYLLEVCSFLMRDIKEVDLDGSRVELGELEGEEIAIRIYCMIKKYFQQKGNYMRSVFHPFLH